MPQRFQVCDDEIFPDKLTSHAWSFSIEKKKALKMVFLLRSCMHSAGMVRFSLAMLYVFGREAMQSVSPTAPTPYT